MQSLPALAGLDALRDALAQAGRAVFSAPPGSGKTTALPLALLNESWLQGQRIVMLEPRRVATRAAARRMAQVLGDSVGGQVGYQVRGERRAGPQTRIEVITEGLLTRRLQADPELPGVGLLIFDEFHERSLDVDLALALALDVRENLRPDLRILVMSATLDATPLARLLGDAPVIQAGGRLHPVEIHYGRDVSARDCGAAVARTAVEALANADGDVLAFLPGMREMRDAQRAFQEPGVQVHLLHGSLPAADQDAALRPDLQGRRKLILATNIAQTSLTVEGVRAVVDGGWERQAVFDLGAAANRLETVRISQATAEQRSGRAGREAPGQAWRCWSAETQARLSAFDTAEILRSDLSRMALELAAWGATPSQLAFLQLPGEVNWNFATESLQQLDAVDDSGRITHRGRELLRWPLSPRLAQLVSCAERQGLGETGIYLAALLESRTGSGSDDLQALLERQWQPGNRAERVAEDVLRPLKKQLKSAGRREVDAAGRLIAGAYPERVARQRSDQPGVYRCADGGEAVLAPDSALRGMECLAIAHWSPGRSRQVRLAAPVQVEDLLAERPAGLVECRRASWDGQQDRLQAEAGWFLGALPLKTRPAPVSDDEAVPVLLDIVRRRGLAVLPWNDAATQLRCRIASLRCWNSDQDWPAMDDAALLVDLEHWLGPFLAGMRRLSDLARLDLCSALLSRLPFELQGVLPRLAPERVPVPAGGQMRLRYAEDGSPPHLAVRLQMMFGARQSPTVNGGQVAVTLELLSPAQRPIQITRDLAGFWAGSYAEVRREMRGRYPKHVWPEDPANAEPTHRAKPKKS